MTFKDFVGSGSTGIIGAINYAVIPLIFGLSFLVFIWGVLKYFFLHGGEETEREAGRSFMLWGILGIVVLFGVWALVNMLLSTLGLA